MFSPSIGLILRMSLFKLERLVRPVFGSYWFYISCYSGFAYFVIPVLHVYSWRSLLTGFFLRVVIPVGLSR